MTGHIRFKQVSFAYASSLLPDRSEQEIDSGKPGRLNVIDSLSLDVHAGEVIGITGPPGSGKTTLLNLLTRRYDITSGEITIDGTEIKSIRIADLHRHISLVPQEPYLFSGTIRDNIVFGMETDDRHLSEAIQKAALEETISTLPKGLETQVGERGIILSGGQKQRIVLARALLRDTPVMLFDDPVGQVDFQTARHIIGTIRKMAGDKTIFISSHRTSAISFANRIIVLDDGRIIEKGTHEELIAQKGYYARSEALQRLEAGEEGTI